MRNEDLKTRLIALPFVKIQERVNAWRAARETYIPNNPKPAKKRSAKRASSVERLAKGLSPEEAAALLKQLEGL